MNRNRQLKRVFLLGFLLVTAMACLVYRLVDLQVLRHAELSAKARNNTQRTFVREPRRGDILDVRGNQLATSIFVKTVCADPSLIGSNSLLVARAVAPALELPEAAILKLLQRQLSTNANGKLLTNRYVVIKRKVAVEKWQQAYSAMTNLTFGVDETKLTKKEKAYYRDLRAKAVFTEQADDQLRIYPNQNLAAHVLGYVGMSERENSAGEPVTVTAGKDGVEATLNQLLTGVRGWRQTETDRRHREIYQYLDQDVLARSGNNVFLTIDSGVQYIVETELAEAAKKHTPLSISCIVVRPKTGEIVAMATLPNFNPNNVIAAPEDARRNRVISDMSEPGSTFKIVVVSGALNDNLVTLRDSYDCENGRFAFAGKILRDHEHYGVLSVEDIIVKSSNIGTAKIGIKMGPESLYRHITEFGFGQRSGIPLPGEIGGWVYPPSKWSKVDISRIPMGQSMTATPLQMVMAMSAIANRGMLMRPMLIHRVEDAAGHIVAKYDPQIARRVASETAAREMVTALKKVVSKDGTAERAKLEHYTVAGKTGTAQKVVNRVYAAGKYFSSFIGFFPADDPELCISVVMDEPKQGYYGGQTAAPVFKRIAERSASYLKIKPDLLPVDGPQTAASTVPTTPKSLRPSPGD